MAANNDLEQMTTKYQHLEDQLLKEKLNQNHHYANVNNELTCEHEVLP